MTWDNSIAMAKVIIEQGSIEGKPVLRVLIASDVMSVMYTLPTKSARDMAEALVRNADECDKDYADGTLTSALEPAGEEKPS